MSILSRIRQDFKDDAEMLTRGDATLKFINVAEHLVCGAVTVICTSALIDVAPAYFPHAHISTAAIIAAQVGLGALTQLGVVNMHGDTMRQLRAGAPGSWRLKPLEPKGLIR